MAKFQNYFKLVVPKPGVTTMSDNSIIGDQGTYANYTWYQRLIQGSASRITRYREYDNMDNDVEIARSLDTIAEEMIGSDPNSDTPLDLIIQSDKEQHIPTATVMTLKAALRYWCDLHSWNIRLFKISRVTIKYGDCFFLRKKETQKWEYVHPKHVVAAIVDDRDMTKVLGWQIKRDVKVPNSPNNQPVGNFGSYSNELVDTFSADEVVWFTLNDDIGESAPFGDSVLRAVYRAQKQKELLEDAVIIYRIQRAPERRVFYIDVGKMPPQRVKSYLEGIKNEIRQRKVPTMGGGIEQVDSVYNPQSMSEDFFFASRPDGRGSRVDTLPGGCLSLDTQIPLLDGRDCTLEQLITEHQQGKQNWTYSVDTNTGEIVPGMISWAGITNQDAEVMTLTLDNGNVVTCTPDHKFPVWGKGYVEAKDLTSDDSIIHFETQLNPIGTQSSSKQYTQVYDHKQRDWKFVHRLVREYFDNKNEENVLLFEETANKKEIIHHKDINRFNNNPDNLVWMGKQDHFKLHGTLGKYANTKRIEKQNNDPEWKKQVYEKSSRSLSRKLKTPGECRNQMLSHLSSVRCTQQNVEIQFCDDMMTIVRYLFDGGHIEVDTMVEKINNTVEFMQLWNILNNSASYYDDQTRTHSLNKISTVFKKHHLDMLLKQYGYNNWTDFKQERLRLNSCTYNPNYKQEWSNSQVTLMKMLLNLVTNYGFRALNLAKVLESDTTLKDQFVNQYNSLVTEYRKKMTDGKIRNHHFDKFAEVLGFGTFKEFLQHKHMFNHRIVAINKNSDTQPVGTLTIDQKEHYHGHHNFALSAGIFTKNSGLGELSDLEYFQWKVFRGLRIPLSYMKEGQDNALFSDGKTGIAYIQELRFAMYIKRLQNYVGKVLDSEFKRYLRVNEITIDPAIFYIKLPEPENFGIYRQQQLDGDLLGTYSNANGIEHLSKRFTMSKYLQLTQEEILFNQRLRAEELGLDPDNLTKQDLLKIYGPQMDGGEMGGMGMTAGMLGPSGGFGGEMGGEMMGGEMMGGEMMGGEIGGVGGTPEATPPPSQ